jgi:hypothetical protein
VTSHQQSSTALKAQDPNTAKFVHLDKSRGELWFENPIGQGMDSRKPVVLQGQNHLRKTVKWSEDLPPHGGTLGMS